jgi:hypothetical protein
VGTVTRWRPGVALVFAAGATFAAGCLSDASGPGAHGRARFALAPTFATVGPQLVAFDQIRVTVVRASCAAADSVQPGPVGRTAVDTLVPFPAELDSINLAIVVPLEAPREEFLVFVRLITAAGDTAFRTAPYPACVVAFAGAASAVLEPLLEYVGIGANAVSVVISTVETLVSFGNVLDLAATALDATGNPIPGTPIAWSSLDPAKVLVPDAGLGRVLGGVERGPARIVARLPTGLADTVLITAQPLPSLLSIVSGDNQQGVPGLPLPLPLRVRVTGPDNGGVQAVPVQFRPLVGGALLQDAVVLSDAAGYAQTVGTLPLLPLLTPVFEASVAGLPSVVFGGLALAPIASIAQVLVTPAAPLLDALLAPLQFTAVARDSGGNVVPVTFAWASSNPTVAAVDPVTGLASAVGNGVATITATAQGVSGTAQLDVFQRVAQLIFGTQPGNTIAGVPLSLVEVRALDPLGSVAQNFTGPVTLGLTGCPATLLGTPAVAAVEGVATFPNLIIQQACTGLRLTTIADTLPSTSSAPFSVMPGPAAIIAPAGGAGQTGTVAGTLAQPLLVRVTDQYDNPVSGYAVSWATVSGLLSPTSSLTDASGLASSSWTLGTLAGTQSAQAGAGTLSGSPVGFAATALPGPAALIAQVSGDGQIGTVATTLGQPLVVRVTDQFGNGVGGYPVSWVAPGGGVLSPPSSATDASGLASSTWTLGTLAGTQNAEARAGSLAGSPVAFPAQAIAGAATQLVYLQQPTSAVLGVVLSPVRVAAQDQYGNIDMTWATPVTIRRGSGLGTLLGTTNRNPVNGVATFDDLLITLLPSLYTLIASSGTLPEVESAPFNVL